jgi:hypothetical protein
MGGDLGEVVVDAPPVVVGVVLGGAVGDLDDQPARPLDQQRERVPGRHEVGVDREAEDPQSVGEGVLPHGLVPLREVLAAPDVVDQHVEAAPLGVGARREPFDLLRDEVVRGHGDPGAARGRHEVGGVLDGLRPVVLAASLAGRSAGDVHRGACRAELHRDAPACTSRRARDQRHPSGERLFRSCHGADPPGEPGQEWSVYRRCMVCA